MYSIQSKDTVGQKNVPVIFNTHGGGFYFPLGEDEVKSSGYFAKKLKARVFLPDYRTSIEAPFPTPFADCVQSLEYLVSHESELGIDKDKIVLFGGSAGACLATGLAMYLRDHNGVKPRGQILIIPVTDRGFHYPSHKEYEDAAWSENANEHAWELYLPKDDVELIEYAVPMESKNLTNLPPAYIEVAEMDILRDQGLAYGEKLKEAGVSVTEKIIKGGYHGYASDQTNPYVQEIIAVHAQKMAEFLKDK